MTIHLNKVNGSNNDAASVSRCTVSGHKANPNDQSKKHEPKAGTCQQKRTPCENEPKINDDLDIGIKNVQSFGAMHQENFITVNNSNTDTIPVSKVQVATHEARILNDQNSKHEPKAATCPQQMRPCKNETYSCTWTRKTGHNE